MIIGHILKRNGVRNTEGVRDGKDPGAEPRRNLLCSAVILTTDVMNQTPVDVPYSRCYAV